MPAETPRVAGDTPPIDQAVRRIVRVPMPVGLIRDMDAALVAGAGGYSTREEFMADAIRDKLLELTYQDAPPGPGEAVPAPPVARDARGDGQNGAAAATADASIIDLDETILSPPLRGHVMSGEAAVQDVVLLGLHNRDYTSLWALSQLAELLRDQPQPLAAVLNVVTERAWELGARLRPLDARATLKITALFPTNRSKVQSASGQFRAFAIGTVRESVGQLRADGPLFVWKALQVRANDGKIEVGLTDSGWDLLAQADGVSLRLPQAPERAERFLSHLAKHAPADLGGLIHALRGAGERLGRSELIAAYRAAYPEWTEAQASTNAAGYVARGREWGLIEPKLVERRYGLTTAGERELARLA